MRCLGLEQLGPGPVTWIGGSQQVLVDFCAEGRGVRGVEREQTLERCLGGGRAARSLPHDRIVEFQSLRVATPAPQGICTKQQDLWAVLLIGGRCLLGEF